MPLNEIAFDPSRELFRQLNNSRWEKVIYWKTPQVIHHTGEPHEQAGWIQLGDSSDTAAIGKMRAGWYPLEQFGSTGVDSKNRWNSILSHPEGRAQFPVSQILAYRWYRAANLRHDWPTMPRGPWDDDDRKMVRLFPQLAGVPVKEFGCPNCTNRVFGAPKGLFQHLFVHHDMKPESIFAWGEQMGIDFGDQLRERSVVTVTFEDAPDVPLEEEEPEGPAIETVGIAPSTQSARAKFARVEQAKEEARHAATLG